MTIDKHKWDKYLHLPEIESVRKKIIDTYSNKLQFIEESHQYFLDGVEYDCVSNITHRFKPTSTEAMAERCYQKGLKDPNYKYAGMTKEEILKQWKQISSEACEFGTTVHAFGESMFYYMTEQDEKIVPEVKDRFSTGEPIPQNETENAVLKFWQDIPESVVPVLAETRIFNQRGTPYAGTFDILFYYVKEPNSPQNGLYIMDYKTNGTTAGDMEKEFQKMDYCFNDTRLLFPFNDLQDCSRSFYKLQLACYQIPIEYLGFKVIARRLIWLHTDGTYTKIPLEDYSLRMKQALNIK